MGLKVILQELKKDSYTIERIRERAGQLEKEGKWNYGSLLHEDDGEDILKGLRKYAQNREVKGSNIRGSAQLGAKLLGITLPWGYTKKTRKWLFQQLDRIHAKGFISPAEVNENYNVVYRCAQQLFGDLADAMEAWKPGSYRESAREIRRGIFNQNHELNWLVERLSKIERGELDLSSSNLRTGHRPEYNTLRRLAQETGASYESFLRRLGFMDHVRISEGEVKEEGTLGELFTLIYLHGLRIRGDVVDVKPFDSVHKKISLMSGRGEIFPDFLVQFPDDENWCIVETKSGYYSFTPNKLRNEAKRGIFDRYIDSGFVGNEGFGKPRLHAVHLHFPYQRTHPDTVKMLTDRGIVVVDNERFAKELSGVEDLVGEDIPKLYEEFVARPFVFVRDPEKRVMKTLEGKVQDLINALPF